MALNPSCNNIDRTRLPVIGDPPFPPAVAEKAKWDRVEVRGE